MLRILFKILYPFVRVYWFVARPKTYGVKCVVEYNGNILMIRNTYGAGWWTFPGGGVKHDETALDAARREVMEEVGVNVCDLRHIGEFMATNEYKHDTITIFAGSSRQSDFTIDHWEILEARWFPRDHLPEGMSDYAKKILTMLHG